MSTNKITLEDPNYSYMFGFMQSDGSLYEGTRNRGKLTVELKQTDRHILDEFQSILPYNSSVRERTRKTNFSNSSTSVIWTVCMKEFRDTIKDWGMPVGKKSNLIDLPKQNFITRDYFRGLIDGDGSVGITAKGYPFISFTTDSDNIIAAYIELLQTVINKRRTCNRNSRDNIYNLCVYRKDAQLLADYLYYEGCLCLQRKLDATKKFSSWTPSN